MKNLYLLYNELVDKYSINEKNKEEFDFSSAFENFDSVLVSLDKKRNTLLIASLPSEQYSKLEEFCQGSKIKVERIVKKTK